MQNLQRGQRFKIPPNFTLTFGSNYDVSCFGLDGAGKLIGDDYMIFYNQLASPGGSIKLNITNTNHIFTVNLAPEQKIKKLSFVITADDKSVSTINGGISCKSETFSFDIASSDFKGEKAIILCEIYIKDNEWRFNGIAQGFNDGLSAVIKHYGGEVEESGQASPSTPTPPQSTPTPPQSTPSRPVSPAPASGSLNAALNKNSSPVVISLAADIGSNRPIELSASWNYSGAGPAAVDLDFRAGLLLPDGRMSVITAGNLLDLNQKPYISHSGDDQQGSRGSEKILVNPQISRKFGGKVGIVFNVYSAISKGSVSITSLKPVMELKTSASNLKFEFNPAIETNSFIYTYAFAIAVIDGDNMSIQYSGEASRPTSDHSPWLEWTNRQFPDMNFYGPFFFKGITSQQLGLFAESVWQEGHKSKRLCYIDFKEL